MLTHHEIQAMSEDIIRLYVAIEDDLLVNIAKRFDVNDEITPDTATDWQVKKLGQLGALRKENIQTIKRYSVKTSREINRIIADGGYKALDFDEQIYQRAFSEGLLVAMPVPIKASPVLKQVIKGAIDNTRGYFNLINTTALQSADSAFLRIINQTYLETSMGITDYNTSIRKAIRQLADNGITGADYISTAGRHTRNHIDVAVRRAILTSSGQTAGVMQVQRAKEWGSNLVEVTSHSGARPDHARWQGKIYSLDGGTKEYPNLAKVTGYGTVTGLCGANCKHRFYPYFEGLSRQRYTPYDLEKNDKVYEQSQQQRKLERDVREQKRRILTADASGDTETKSIAQLKLKAKEAELKQFVKSTGRTQRTNRQQVLGFDHSQASQAVWANKKSNSLAIQKEKEYTEAVKEFKDNIASGKQPLQIIAGKQNQHIKNSGNYVQGKSYIYGSSEDAQKLINQYAGTGIFEKNGKGEFVKKEIIKTDTPIGIVIGADGNEFETSTAKIHYRKTGAHIVPRKD